MPIQILDPNVAAKIAAGEVVERPANVAKELIENSLDAGATEIRVDLREGGQRLLRVSDNGHGIPPDQVPLAFQRHATSKVASADDLNHIGTLGFRGEALYSIAAVTNVTLASRHGCEESAVQLRLEAGEVVHQSRTGAPVGTSVTVEHLFHNVPARRKFLRKAGTEAGRITALVQRYALAYPECRFVLVNEGRETFRTAGTGNRFDVLTQIRGLEQARQMIALDVPESRSAERPDALAAEKDTDLPPEVEFMPADDLPAKDEAGRPLRVSGFTSLPSLNRANRAGIDLFVNRRYVEDRSLTHAVVQAYHTLLPVGRFPLAAVFVEMDTAEVDVNVHPQKTQIRFVDERAVFSAVQRAVHHAVVQQAPVPDMSIQAEQELDEWRSRRSQILQAGSQARFTFQTVPPRDQPTLTAQSDMHDATGWAIAVDTEGSQQMPALDTEHEAEGQDPAAGASETVTPQPSGKLPPLRVVGQVGALYIIAEGPQGVLLIDQHAAHERILYEQFMAQRADTSSETIASQQILEPIPLHVGHEITGAIEQYLEELNRVGFQIEPFGGDSFLLRGVPVVLSGQDPRRILEEIVASLAQRRDLVEEEMEAQLVKMVCKRAAIKAGQQLSDIEMRELVRQLEACESPRTCPHGRPTMIQLSAGELEKAFGRI